MKDENAGTGKVEEGVVSFLATYHCPVAWRVLRQLSTEY
jgi:hypothetical protein